MSGVDIVVLTALGVRGLYTGVKQRNQMKAEDEEIRQEAARERQVAMEAQLLDVQVKHHKHKEHPLKEADVDGEFLCGICGRGGQGRRYLCLGEGCGFEAHRVCGASPVILVKGEFGSEGLQEMVQTFAHPEHGAVKRVDGRFEIFDCSHCNTVGKGLRYQCESEGCEESLHPVCAKSPTRLNTFMHPEHDLELITRPFFTTCVVCKRGRKSKINNRVYACKKCKFYVHPTCSLWPQHLFSDLHVKPHPLQLIVSSSASTSASASASASATASTCKTCNEKCNGSVSYHCEICRKSYHPLCLLRFALNEKGDMKVSNAFKKEVAEMSEFHVEFAGIDSLGLIG